MNVDRIRQTISEPSNPMDDKQKAEEEAKRLRHWDPQQRWRVIQETLAWADAQQATPRNSKESCLARQAVANSGGAARGDV